MADSFTEILQLDLAKADERTAALVGFFHHREHLFEFRVFIWSRLQQPGMALALIGQKLGISGGAKLILLRVLQRFLREADRGCEACLPEPYHGAPKPFAESMQEGAMLLGKMDHVIERIASHYSEILNGGSVSKP